MLSVNSNLYDKLFVKAMSPYSVYYGIINHNIMSKEDKNDIYVFSSSTDFWEFNYVCISIY